MTAWPHASGELARRIRDYDWAATPLGPSEQWSNALKVVVDLMLSSDHAMQLAWGPARTVLYNDAYAPMLGARHPSALAKPLNEAWPDIWDEVEPLVERVFAGETARWEDLPLVMTRNGSPEDTWWNFSYSPVRDESGKIAGLLNVTVDATAKHQAERAERERDEVDARLQENEARFRALVTTGANSVYRMSADWRVMYELDSKTLGKTTGPIYDWPDKYILEKDRQRVFGAIEAAVRTKSLFDLEHRVRLADGSIGWVLSRAVPLFDANGEVIEWFGTASDVSQRRQAVEALLENRERFRTLFETMDEGFCIMELVRDANERVTDLIFLQVNGAFQRQTGFSNVTGRTISELLPNFEQHWLELFARVASTGESELYENYVQDVDRWYRVHNSLIGQVGSPLVAVVFEDITERKRAEKALRLSEERKAFLLELSDALRPLNDVRQIQDSAMRLLGEHLKADRAFYYFAERDAGGWVHVVKTDYYDRPDMVSLVGRYPEATLNPVLFAQLARGETLIVPDVERLPGLTPQEIAGYRSVQVGSQIAVPLLKDGVYVAGACVNDAHARAWTKDEVELVVEVAERTWAAVERARAETALQESQQRFQQFAQASAAALWIRDASTLTMEYVSPAISSIYGVEPGALLGDVKRWAALIVPEDRDLALEHIERARRGEAVIHEFRVRRPRDQAFRWLRNTVFPLLDGQGQVQRIGGIAEDVSEAKLALAHQGVLLAELQHRVRNIMAVIRSVAQRTASGAQSVEDYQSLLEGRLLALARVQVLLTREANASGSLRSVLESEVSAQAPRGARFELVGADIQLSPKAAEVLTLAVHELATNALKYGAFSVPEGRLSVTWSQFERRGRAWLALDWREAAAQARPPSTRRGFGSDLIEGRIPYELGGMAKITIEPEGARCHLEFPLEARESVLETSAPAAATVFGGTLDMTGAPDLSGRRVLVIEDDYYLAGDTAAALRAAGAEVLGPSPSEAAVLDVLETETPTHAVVDLNLGGGPRFEIAQLLKTRGVSLVFLTGYDLDVIPKALSDCMGLQKPTTFRKIVAAVSEL